MDVLNKKIFFLSVFCFSFMNLIYSNLHETEGNKNIIYSDKTVRDAFNWNYLENNKKLIDQKINDYKNNGCVKGFVYAFLFIKYKLGPKGWFEAIIYEDIYNEKKVKIKCYYKCENNGLLRCRFDIYEDLIRNGIFQTKHTISFSSYEFINYKDAFDKVKKAFIYGLSLYKLCLKGELRLHFNNCAESLLLALKQKSIVGRNKSLESGLLCKIAESKIGKTCNVIYSRCVYLLGRALFLPLISVVFASYI